MQTGTGPNRLDRRLNRIFWTQCLLASALLGLAVVLGAFFAHSMEGKISEDAHDIMETGNRYHFYFAFAILASALLWRMSNQGRFLLAGWTFFAGILLFSGSLYLLAIRELFHLTLSWVGPITPLGGLCFLAGCLILCTACIRMLKE